MAGSFFGAFVQGCLPNAPFPFIWPRNQEVHDGQPHAISISTAPGSIPSFKKSTPVVNPATEEAMYEVALGSKADRRQGGGRGQTRVLRRFPRPAARSASRCSPKSSRSNKTRMKDIGAAVSDEMGAPLPMAEKMQAGAGLGHIASTLEVLKNYHFEEPLGSAMVVREPSASSA